MEHSKKPSGVQPATEKLKGIATSALEQNEEPGRGRGVGEEGSHLRCRKRKEASGSFHCRWVEEERPLLALKESGKRAVAQVPLAFSLGNESTLPTCRASARPLPPAQTCKSLCPSEVFCPSFFPSSIIQHMNAAVLTVLQARQKPLQEGPF